MTLSTMLIIAAVLSAEAYYAAGSKGSRLESAGAKQMLKAGALFALFQALMPLIGCILGKKLISHAEIGLDKYGIYIAGALVALAGVKMITAFFSKRPPVDNASMKAKELVVPAVSAAMSALLSGIAYAFVPDMKIPFVLAAAGAGGAAAFLLGCAGIRAGKATNGKSGKKACLTCGMIAVFMGIKIIFAF